MKSDINKKEKEYVTAFTLAEVLITLGIIGIIAAMTIPNLIKEYQKESTITQLKETYAILNNALNAAKVDNGIDANLWYVSTASEGAASGYFATNYIIPYVKTNGGEICGTSDSSQCQHTVLRADKLGTYAISSSDRYSFVLANGAIVSVWVGNLNGSTISACRVQIYFDINGKKSPNIAGRDAFLVELGGNYGNGDKNKFVPYGYKKDRSTLLSEDSNACTKTGDMCFALIQYDGWKIADDYPWN